MSDTYSTISFVRLVIYADCAGYLQAQMAEAPSCSTSNASWAKCNKNLIILLTLLMRKYRLVLSSQLKTTHVSKT